MKFYRSLKGVDPRVLILDNALVQPDCRVTSEKTEILAGDNTSWEFSAWDKAIRLVESEIWSYDLVHLVTSAFNSLYTAYIPRVSVSMLEWAASRAVCLGHIDCSNAPVEVLSYCSQHWTRSCFLFLRPAELKALDSLVSVGRQNGLFSGDPRAPFAATARISAECQRNIIDWLTGADTGQGVRWHSAFQLTHDRLRYFEDKALAILNEHLLSARLRASGCQAIDITWLHGRLAETRNPAPNVTWLAQVRGRLVDAVSPPVPVLGQ